MDTMLILGDGALGRAVEAGALQRGHAAPRRHGANRAARRATAHRPPRPRRARRREPHRRGLAGRRRRRQPGGGPGCRLPDASSSRRPAGPADRARVESLLDRHGAVAVAASNFSLGVVLFGRLVEAAVELFGPLEAFDPYLVEWHRRSKRDRPSGTATDLARADRRRPPATGDRRRPRGRLGQGGRVARDAPGRFRCRRRDDRAAPDRPRPIAVRGRDPRRRRLAGARPARRPASTPSTPSSTSSSLATRSLPERDLR